jgi:hypothetical protein
MINFKENETEIVEDESNDEYDYSNEEPLEEEEIKNEYEEEKDYDYCD